MYLNEPKSFDLEYSVQQLKKVDPALTEMFNQVQVNPLEPGKNYFKSLTRSIIYQQLSGSAAKKYLIDLKKFILLTLSQNQKMYFQQILKFYDHQAYRITKHNTLRT